MLANITFKNIFYDYADSNIRDKFLMSSPVFIAIYLVNFVLHLYLIPLFMKNRKPFNFWTMNHVADVLIIIQSGYFVCVGMYYHFWRLRNFDIICIMINDAKFEAELCWQFLMSMIIYVFHNFAFSLSKRNCLTSKYLIIHHSFFPIVAWMVLRYYPGGHVIL